MRNKQIIIHCFVVFIFLFGLIEVRAEQVSPPGMGFGVCHWPGTYGMKRSDSTINWFYWGGGAEDWNVIEPVRGEFTFAPLDSQLEKHFKSKPNTFFWLDIMTAMPSTVPDWAKNDQTLGYMQLATRASTFPIWNKEFQKVFEVLMTKTSEHIYSSSFQYRDKLKAVIMMSGGGFGEMITYSGCPEGANCKKYLAAGYTDDVYYDAMVNWLTPLYMRLFPDYPIVLQLGGGIYGNGIGRRVAKTLVDRYGSRMFIKWNGWNRKFAQEPTNTDKYYHETLRLVADRARVGLEPGYAWAIPDSETEEMRQSIYDSLMKTLQDVPVSYFCLQDKYFEILTDTQIKELSLRMGGIHATYPTFPPLATQSPSPTVSPTATVIPLNPDLDNSGAVTLLDYFYTLIAVNRGLLPQGLSGDVNRDGEVNNLDMQVIIQKLKR